MGHRCVVVVVFLVTAFSPLGLLGFVSQLRGHFVFNFVLICWEDAVISVSIIWWCHWLYACSLKETYWTYSELDYFLISDIRQVIVLHAKPFAVPIWGRLKATRQKTAIAENWMFGGHGWTGYLSVSARLLGRSWASIMPWWKMARTSQPLRFCDALSTWCVRISLWSNSVLLSLSLWYKVVLFEWLNSWHWGRRRAILSRFFVFLHIYLLDVWWIVCFRDRRDSLISIRFCIVMVCKDSWWVHSCHSNFSIICATVSISNRSGLYLLLLCLILAILTDFRWVK